MAAGQKSVIIAVETGDVVCQENPSIPICAQILSAEILRSGVECDTLNSLPVVQNAME